MRTLILATVLFLSGCNLFSDHPLSDPAKEPVDAALIGTWIWNEDNDSGFVHIGTDAERKSLLITMVEFKNDGRIETTEFKGHTTRLSSQTFLNLKWTKPREMAKGYFFVTYAVKGDELEFSFLDTAVFEKAVRSGTLKGDILSPDRLTTKVVLHASQEELRRYVLQNLKSLTAKPSKLKRLTLPRFAP